MVVIAFCWELKLILNVLDALFKFVHTNLRNIIIATFKKKINKLLRIECVIKTIYVETEFAGDEFLMISK